MGLTAEVEVYTLVARYNQAIDRGDGESVAETFVEGGVLDIAGRICRGREQIAAFAARVPERMTTPRHVTSNLLVDAHGDAGTLRAYLQLYCVDTESGRLELAVSGVYNDRLVRDNGWKFAARTFTFDPGTQLRSGIPL